MNKFFYLIIFFVLIGCSNNKVVYWCGDHPCINKKEKEAYFKKTMIVEVKNLKMKDKKNNSELEKIMRQAKINEKKRINSERDLAKQAKLDEKRRIKEEKRLTKQAKLDEKRRIKEEKDLENRIKKDEDKLIKKQKNKQDPKVKLETKIRTPENNSGQFSDLVEKIIERNSFKPFPDINDIPN